MKQADRVKSLRPYRRTETKTGLVRMHMNENQSGRGKGLTLTGREIARYPEEEPLTRRMEETLGIPRGGLMLFNGASEAIMCAALALVDPGDTVVTARPEFQLIPHYLALAGANLLEVPMKDRAFRMERMEAAVRAGRMLFISVPHNPTGAAMEHGTILKWCREEPQTLFVIDEAYASYARGSLAKEAAERDNLIVIRSFSKDYALAGLRLGAAIGPVEAIQAMAKIRTPYSINAAALKAGKEIPASRPTTEDTVREIGKLAGATEQAGLRTVTGCGNFFLIEGPEAGSFAAFCEERNILIRTLPDGSARVSPAGKTGNERYLMCLREWRKAR